MQSYSVLNALPPEAFLCPDNFRTPLDSPEYDDEQYLKGLDAGRAAGKVWISSNGCWGAMSQHGGFISSYEGIGYHSGTAALLRGFLDSGAEVKVYRGFSDSKGTVIKESSL